MNELLIITRNQGDCLERIFQTIRYRRFDIESFALAKQSNQYHITLKISGSLPITRLTSQLKKLYDVLELKHSANYETGHYVKSA